MDVEAQLRFYDDRWPELQRALGRGGARAALDYIEQFSGEERLVFYTRARRGLVLRDWEGKTLAAYVDVVDAGLAHLAALAAGAGSDAELRVYEGLAHGVGFNLAADLARCWPDADGAEDDAQLRRGLRAAQECVALAERLGRRPEVLANDHWAAGIHQLALGDRAGAGESWRRALDRAREAAQASGDARRASGDDFLVQLVSGYLGLLDWVRGDSRGREAFERALAAFAAWQGDPERRADADVAIGQLQRTRELYAPA